MKKKITASILIETEKGLSGTCSEVEAKNEAIANTKFKKKSNIENNGAINGIMTTRNAMTNMIGKMREKIGIIKRFAKTERKLKDEKKDAVKGKIPI